MPKKLQLHASNSPRISRGPVQTIALEKGSDLADFRIPLPLLKPLGPESVFLKAFKVLASDDQDLRTQAALTVQHLLVGLNYLNPRPKVEIAKLLDIEAAAQLLEARIQQLHFNTQMALLKELATVLGKSTSTLVSNSEIQGVFVEISAKAAKIRRQLSKDGHTAASGGRPSNSPAVIEHMERSISIYARARGAAAVTSTIPSKNAGSLSCYAFADNLFRYATDRPLGHVRQFRQLVATFQDRRKNPTKS